MSKKDFCKSWNVHTTLNNGETFCKLSKLSLKAMLLYNIYSPINTNCPLCPHEGNPQKYGFALDSYKLLKIWMENMWRPSCHRVTPRNTVWLCKILPFSL